LLVTQAMAIQQEYNTQLWDRQNAYNTPQAQMERLQAAGLNPRLIYGGGSANTGNAGPIASTDTPVRESTRGEVPNLALARLQARQMDAQYAATTQATEIAQKRGALMDVQTGLGNLKLMNEAIRSKNYKDLAQAELDTRKFIALRSGELFANERSRGSLMGQTSELNKRAISEKDLDIAFKNNRNELAKLGIYEHDDIKWRVLLQAANRMGIDIGELLAKGAQKLKYLLTE